MTSSSEPSTGEMPCQTHYTCAGCCVLHATLADSVLHEGYLYCLDSFAKIIRGYQRPRSTFTWLVDSQQATIETLHIKAKNTNATNKHADRRIVLISGKK